MSVFRSLKHHNFRLHFIGQAISLIGTWMQRVAISWLVYRITGSALLLGLVTFLSLIPSLVLAPFAGSFIDRHNKFKVVMVTQIALMVQAGVLAAMVWLNYYSMIWISVLSLAQGLINAFDTTARQALMVDLVDDKEDLPNAIALNSSAFNAARLVGPALAGIILSSFGEDICFLINFLSFIAVICCLVMMKLALIPASRSDVNIWADLRKGYDYLRESPDLSSLILLLAASSLLVIPYTTLLPVFAKDVFHGDATTFSWFESAAGLGALFGAVFMATLKPGRDLIRLTILSSTVFAVALLGLAVSSSIVLALAATAATGGGLMIQNSAINTYLQTHASSEMRARTLSYYIMSYQGMLPIGSLVIGYLAHYFGVGVVVFAEGIMGILIVLVFMLHQRGISHWIRVLHVIRLRYLR
ncbi:MFS transporter [Chitinophaga pinensis]|uniref:Major facilitator superfamily MFS_1 n=1 Tax=Chitinophaga pinensis (strain ATCC 43595 / DSM 2588 / LMG 13176 / NBRC 15968 / NCIMB 11800 / UQM 2034) TaxID=485918 RepID=A0A979H053_CHIPD|nr:MFS transporter [Chitinophaga pinensis]ACU64564.1 major facilitator superfamily MFS_1 [Chitinophaga pinensis DSM 2588]